MNCPMYKNDKNLIYVMFEVCVYVYILENKKKCFTFMGMYFKM